MSGIYHPTRGGTRGGQGDFSWEAVKQDSKSKEYYLGHSVMAPTGRWAQNKDVLWYAKNGDGSASGSGSGAVNDELEMIKNREAEALAEMLGGKPIQRKYLTDQAAISNQELKKMVGQVEHEQEELGHVDASTVKGLGFGREKGGSNATSQASLLEDGIKSGSGSVQKEVKAAVNQALLSFEDEHGRGGNDGDSKAKKKKKKEKSKKSKKDKHEDDVEDGKSSKKKSKKKKHKSRRSRSRSRSDSDSSVSSDSEYDKKRSSKRRRRSYSRPRSRSRSPVRSRSYRDDQYDSNRRRY